MLVSLPAFSQLLSCVAPLLLHALALFSIVPALQMQMAALAASTATL